MCSWEASFFGIITGFPVSKCFVIKSEDINIIYKDIYITTRTAKKCYR